MWISDNSQTQIRDSTRSISSEMHPRIYLKCHKNQRNSHNRFSFASKCGFCTKVHDVAPVHIEEKNNWIVNDTRPFHSIISVELYKINDWIITNWVKIKINEWKTLLLWLWNAYEIFNKVFAIHMGKPTQVEKYGAVYGHLSGPNIVDRIIT